MAAGPVRAVFPAALFLFGIYTNVSIPIGGGTLPMVSAIPGAVLLLLAMRNALDGKALFLTLSLALVPFLLLPLAPAADAFVLKRLIACGQFGYSLLLGYILFAWCSQFERHVIARFLSMAIPVYLLLLAAEVLTPLSEIVISYMKVYQAAYDVTILARDANIGGGHRPKFFTSETSYVAMTVAFLIGAYVWVETRSTKYLASAAYVIIGVFVVRSPIVLCAGLTIIADFTYSFVRDRQLRRSSLIVGPLLTILGVLVASSLLGAVNPLVERRLRGIQSGSDYSVTYRTYGSYAAGIAVANDYPLAGVGIGSQELAASTVQSVFSYYGVPALAIAKEWRKSLTNAPAYCLVIFGYLGTAVFVLYWLWILRRLSGPLAPQFTTLCIILSISYGAVYTPKFVCYIFLFAALNAVISEKRSTLHSAS